jgi:lipoprotein NlpI
MNSVSAASRDLFVRGTLLATLLTGSVSLRAAEESKPSPLLVEAEAAFKKGNSSEAIALASKAIAAHPRDPKAHALRGRFYAESRQPARAIADFDVVLELDPRATQIYQLRGMEHFKLGHFKESVADFDKVIELMPAQGPHHWQRGISCYYAGMFEEGRKQFESHQTVNPNDVENAVWHFLCNARANGVEKARGSLIPISGDSRVPMKEVHALFAGKATPEDVLTAAQGGKPERRNDQLFYAHLYLGLYYEALGDAKRAREHMLKAALDFKADHYMGDVARVHAALLRKAR